MKNPVLIILLCLTGCLAATGQILVSGLDPESGTHYLPFLSILTLVCFIALFFSILSFAKKENAPSITPDEQNSPKDVFESGNEIPDLNPEARFAALFKSNSDPTDVKERCSRFLRKLGKQPEVMQAAVYLRNENNSFQLAGGLALLSEYTRESFGEGEGLSGQAAAEKTSLVLRHLPADYLQVASGLGKGVPSFLYIIPILYEDACFGVLEIASFNKLFPDDLSFTKYLGTELGKYLRN